MDLNIDKQNGKVCYNDEKQPYWNIANDEKYISVTTLISKFERPFDKDFWSGYKALEKLIPKESWTIEKKFLLKNKIINKEILKVYDISESEYNKTQQDILDDWDKNNKESCIRGTKIHSELEKTYYKNPKNISLQKYGIGGKFECKKDYKELDIPCGVYPEYLIYRESDDGILKLAGQIDLLIKNNNDIYIIDYKTNKSIDTKSGFDTSSIKNIMMYYPLNNLMDCNFSHYNLQLSTYAWMVKKLHPEFNIKGLILVHYNHEGKVTYYKMEYLKEDVESMLYQYKKELIKEKQRDKRKRIEY